MINQPSHYKIVPSQETQDAVLKGIKQYGLTVFVKNSGVSWTVLCGSGFGTPVSRSSLEILEAKLQELGLY